MNRYTFYPIIFSFIIMIIKTRFIDKTPPEYDKKQFQRGLVTLVFTNTSYVFHYLNNK